MKAYVINGECLRSVDLNNEKIKSTEHYFIIINESEREKLSSDFNIKGSFSKECIESKYNLGIETYNHYYYISLNIPSMYEGKVAVYQISIYFGKNFIIVSSNEESDLIKNIENELVEKTQILLKNVSSPSNKILYLILDRLVLKSLSVIGELERRIQAQEERVLKIGKNVMVNELLALRRQVFKVRRHLNYLTYISDVLLLNENEIINDDMIKYFNNIDIKFSKLDEDLDELYHFIASLREAYEAEISNQLNQVMKVFTMISTIFLPLTLVAGVYGMNFDNMPELHYKYAYFWVLGLMVLGSGIMLLFFKKKKWL